MQCHYPTHASSPVMAHYCLMYQWKLVNLSWTSHCTYSLAKLNHPMIESLHVLASCKPQSTRVWRTSCWVALQDNAIYLMDRAAAAAAAPRKLIFPYRVRFRCQPTPEGRSALPRNFVERIPTIVCFGLLVRKNIVLLYMGLQRAAVVAQR